MHPVDLQTSCRDRRVCVSVRVLVCETEPCQHVTVQVCYNQRKVTVKDPDKLLPSYVAIRPALPRCNRLARRRQLGAQQEVWVRNPGLVVTLQSDRGLMTLSPNGRDWGNKSWAVAVR